MTTKGMKIDESVWSYWSEYSRESDAKRAVCELRLHNSVAIKTCGGFGYTVWIKRMNKKEIK